MDPGLVFLVSVFILVVSIYIFVGSRSSRQYKDKESHDILICPHCQRHVKLDMVWPEEMPAPSQIIVSKVLT